MSQLTRTDVTAVKLLKTHILVGIGSYVHIYDRKSLQLKERLQALDAQKIHGFISNHSKHSIEEIIIYGGKQFTVLSIRVDGSSAHACTSISKSLLCDDWLHSAVWLLDYKIAVLTAHNVVQIWKIEPYALLSTHKSKYNSILYSALLLSYNDDLLIFAGTVYSEVIIQICGEEEALHRLKGHKGVIFSISYDYESEYLITSSDDRSVRVWAPKHSIDHQNDTISYWRNVTLECKYELYGHTARVMRNTFTKQYIVSVGEDGGVCYWDKCGVLVKKRTAHKGGCIWSVDSDESDLITGGGDGAVILHPFTNHKADEKLITGVGTPKHMFFTARTNLVILNDDSQLIQYDIETCNVLMKTEINRESTFQLMSLSSCKQIIAVIDMMGNLNVYTEPCKGSPHLVKYLNGKLQLDEKVLSMHWINNRYLAICLGNGNMHVIGTTYGKIRYCDNFTLPKCKERWLTAAAANKDRSLYVFGDRCGNIHIYDASCQFPLHKCKLPIHTFRKFHGSYGPTTITIDNNRIITTGRNGTVQFFTYDPMLLIVKVMHKNVVNFKWVEKFLDKNQSLVCGFQERDFIVADIEEDTNLIQVVCGGGYRAWDAIRYYQNKDGISELVTFGYSKHSTVHLITHDLNKIKPKTIILGSHVKKINCAKSLSVNDKTYIISGGEDTSVRLSSLENHQLKDMFVFKHLSSVKAISAYKIHESKYLLASAGGRAQICIKKVDFGETQVNFEHVVDYMIKGPDKNRECNQNWRTHTIDFDPETRIMDLEIAHIDKIDYTDLYYVVAACSDSVIRVYVLDMCKKEPSFDLVTEIKYHDTCILKTCKFIREIENKKDSWKKWSEISLTAIFFTVTTKGDITAWNYPSLSDVHDIEEPIYTLENVHKSGINCITPFQHNKCLYTVTGGDDNAVVITKLPFDVDYPETAKKTSFVNIFSAQVTGSLYYERNIVTASIDQRINVMVIDGDEIKVGDTIYTDISDVSGVEFISFDSESKMMRILVYGKGFEVINVSYIDTVAPT